MDRDDLFFAYDQGGSAGHRVWPTPSGVPLPAFPSPSDEQPPAPQASAWTHDACPSEPAYAPVDAPDVDQHRGNVMGVRVPGKLFVPGETDLDPEFLVTWFLYEQTKNEQARICNFYRNVRGYTHVDFHRGAWMGRVDGVPGCSRAEALASVELAAQYCEFPIVNLAIDAQTDPDQNELKPWIDDLVSAGMKIGCLAWQADQLLAPIQLCDYIDWAAPYLIDKGCKVAIHWGGLTDTGAWWDALTCKKYGVCNRFDFMRWTDGQYHYVYHQVNTEAPIFDNRPDEGGIAGNLMDIMRCLRSQKLIIAESDMEAEFNDPKRRLELYGDQKNYWLQSVARDGHRMWGSLNGIRRPVDGRVF